MIIDAEEIERKNREEELREHEKRLKLETEVIKRKLPRPAIIPSELKFGKNKVQ